MKVNMLSKFEVVYNLEKEEDIITQLVIQYNQVVSNLKMNVFECWLHVIQFLCFIIEHKFWIELAWPIIKN